MDTRAVDNIVGRGDGFVHVCIGPEMEYPDFKDHI